MNSKRVLPLFAVVAVIAILCALTVPVSALERGEPNIDVYLPENEVTPGTEATLEMQIANDGEQQSGTNTELLTARATTVEIDDAGPFEVKTDERAVGPIPDGTIVTAPHQVAIPEDVAPGEYDVAVRVRYSYTDVLSRNSNTAQRQTTSVTRDVTVVVPDEPRFEITDVETDVEPGATGDATLEIENVGTQPANQTRATITGGGGVTIDGGAAEVVLGELKPGDAQTVSVEAAIDDATSGSVKPIEVAFTYRDSNGIEREAGPETATLAPAESQSFTIEALEDTLSVGYDGEVTGTLVNEGPRTIDDGVLIVEPMSDSLYVEDTRYALPVLEPGESTAFRYPTDVSGSADEGPRQLRFTVQYTDGDRTTLESDPISERVVVDPRQDEFSIDDDGVSVPAGETREVVLEITNERPETLSNIDARLYAASPLSAPDDEAFVAELEPGESAAIPFSITAGSGASTETHPIELDFEYDTERGSTVLSETYQYPIDVGTTPSDDGDGAAPAATIGGALGLIVVATLGIAYWRRRD